MAVAFKQSQVQIKGRIVIRSTIPPPPPGQPPQNVNPPEIYVEEE